jgi:hypothetical protein
MTIMKKVPKKTLEIDLTGPEGNAYHLLAVASRLSKSLRLNGKRINEEMTSGDYENLVNVFDSYFGHLVTLYR